MGILDTAGPLEVLWAGLYSIALSNFSLELRVCLDDLAVLNAKIKSGEVKETEIGSRRIQVHSTIAIQVCAVISCVFFALSGWFLIFLPGGTSIQTVTAPAFILGSLMVAGGVSTVAGSFVVRWYTSKLRRNLIFQKRKGDTGEYKLGGQLS